MTRIPTIPGYATAAATRVYARTQGGGLPPAHYSHFPVDHLLLSSIGVGTFPGPASDEVDRDYVAILSRALRSGLNVIDTATHYRYGRSVAAVGAAVREAVAAGVPRAAMFLVSKGGFLLFPDGPPADPDAWFAREIVDRGLGRPEDLAAAGHLLSPAYIRHQLDHNLAAMGVQTLDAFLVDQPEVHIPAIGKQAMIQRLLDVFVGLEQAVAEGRIRYYGISSFESLRVHTDEQVFLSLPSMIGLAEKAARQAQGGDRVEHHFRIIQLPFNQVMPEGFTRYNQVTGEEGETSPFQAAARLKVYTMASHTLFKGHLAAQSFEVVERALGRMANAAQRAIQFNRSTPGLGTTLAGISTPAHLEDALAVARVQPLADDTYMAMYQRAG